MPGTDTDTNYELFTKAYQSENFLFAGRLIYQIISTFPELKNLPKDEWQYKFSELMRFLHQTMFVFDDPDTFYEVLATIATRLKRNPDIDWKAILD